MLQTPATSISSGSRGARAPQRREYSPCGGNFMLTPSLMEYLTPDLTLPEQFFMRQQPDDGMGPERALMYAVLKDGIRSFYKNIGATRRKYRKVLLEAETWLTEDTWDYPFSFQVICETLNIDATSLRERLFGWRDAELRRRQQTGESPQRSTSRSPFPTPIDLDSLERISIDTDIDLDQDADLGFESADEEEWCGRVVSIEELGREERIGRAAA